ncbi:uncharacterized protein [Rutidosis leptorrhynchoides]|uniref:uncharacterized protein n=1 Tax=Rutidosis leptorrhynchoides TaxID=125765 RepID=UPI003A98D40E
MDFDLNNVIVLDEEDRLSSLPLELILQILSRVDTKIAIQTCLLLIPRWKLIWTLMPCLNFSRWGFKTVTKFSEFVTHVLSHRNHQVQVSSVKLSFNGAATEDFVKNIVNYAFSHNVQKLILKIRPKNESFPYLFRSHTLKHLTIRNFGFDPCPTPKAPWSFPVLTTLYLRDISLCDDRHESVDVFSKCVNLHNLTLESVTVGAKVLEIITPRLVNLRLISYGGYNVINDIAPQLENLTIIYCSIKELNIPSTLSSFCYKGCSRPYWFKNCFVNKVTLSLRIYGSKMQEHALEIIKMLRDFPSARFLTLNLDIVECICSFPELLSARPSPFKNLIRLNIDTGSRDSCKVKLSTEARNFFFENSPPNATIFMQVLSSIWNDLVRTEEMRVKEVKAKLVADIEDFMKELEQDNILTGTNQAIDKKKARPKEGPTMAESGKLSRMLHNMLPSKTPVSSDTLYKKEGKRGLGRTLSWSMRVKIMIGTAKTIVFLHNTENQIIFRDLKTSNILLDQDFNTKIADFGLARRGPTNGETHLLTQVVGNVGMQLQSMWQQLINLKVIRKSI